MFFALALSLAANACSPRDKTQNSYAAIDSGTSATKPPSSSYDVSSSEGGSAKTREQLIVERAEEIRNGPYDGEPGEGHEAGWDWAKENNITDSSDCEDHGDSFEEGCKAYAEAEVRASEEINAAMTTR